MLTRRCLPRDKVLNSTDVLPLNERIPLTYLIREICASLNNAALTIGQRNLIFGLPQAYLAACLASEPGR